MQLYVISNMNGLISNLKALIITFSSSFDPGKRKALKLGDFGHVVGGGLLIICS